MKKLKYGIVSTASITSRFIDGIKSINDEVVCIASRDLEKAKDFAYANQINKYYGSYDEVYKDDEVNIVYIPVINDLHYECAKQALLHKKHVVLEKPFVTNSKDARELFDIAKRNNCFLFEGVKNLFVPSTEFVKNNLKNIGEVIKIETSQGTGKPFPIGHWMYDVSKGGGAFFGSFSYVFHYLRYLFNKEISNLDGSFIPSTTSDLICNFSFNLDSIVVHSSIDMTRNLDNSCIIYGKRGKIIINNFWRSHHVFVQTDDGTYYEFNDSGNEFVYETKHIQDCINKGLLESPMIKGIDCIKEVEFIEYMYKKWKLIV